MRNAVHFVGFRGDEYVTAVRVFGKPDFFHRVWDVRAQHEVDQNDVVVFARAKDWASVNEPRQQAFDDSAVM